MKNLFLALATTMIFTLIACGGDECSTCTGTDPLFAIPYSSEICDNGDGTVSVSATILGMTQDTTYTADYDAEVATAIADGASCN